MSLKKMLEIAPISTESLIRKIAKECGFKITVLRTEKSDEEYSTETQFNETEIPVSCHLTVEPYRDKENDNQETGVDAYNYRYFGPIRIPNGLMRVFYRAHVIQGADCRGRFVRRVIRYGETPLWFPVGDKK